MQTDPFGFICNEIDKDLFYKLIIEFHLLFVWDMDKKKADLIDRSAFAYQTEKIILILDKQFFLLYRIEDKDILPG